MIYLDSAATSCLKPAAVSEAMSRAVRECASPGRGVHAAAMRAAETVLDCREEAAALFAMDGPENVVFTHNATHGLNIAIFSLIRPGMRVVVSGYEHNAVVRPLYALGAQIDVVDAPLFSPAEMLSGFRRRLPGAAAAVCTHVSNVFGYRLPLEEIARLCREQGVPLIIDAAQSAGLLDLDFLSTGAAFCAMPGHKGLLGPQGTGLLLCRDRGRPLLFGGTGGQSESRTMPPELPERLEAGTMNVCGIAGLLEGIRFVRSLGTAEIRRRESLLCRRLIEGLADMDGLRLFAGGDDTRTGTVSLVPEGMGCEEMAERLGAEGIAVRAGLHCAPLAHATAGTLGTGTVRLSVSPLNTAEEIDRALEAVEKILKKRNKM